MNSVSIKEAHGAMNSHEKGPNEIMGIGPLEEVNYQLSILQNMCSLER